MEEMIIICYGFDISKPNNANAICLNEIINDISKGRNVSIITGGIEDSFTKKLLTDHISIYNVPSYKKRNGKLNFDKWNKDIVKYITEKKLMKNSSTVLTISFPFPIHEAGRKLKSKNDKINWITYNLDPYAYNSGLKFQKVAFLYRFIKENVIFNNANQIMLTHELYNQYSNNVMSLYKSKYHDIGIPLLKTVDNGPYKRDRGETIEIVFTGSISNKVRDPEYMFQLLSQLPESLKYNLHLYGPRKEEIKEKYLLLFGEKLIVHGRVDKKTVEDAISNADFLINIGNTVENQLPSKVLEYISAGKPIINFYTSSNDTSNYYLKQYPQSLLIKKNNIENNQNILDLNRFLQKKSELRIDSKLINNIFHKYTKEEVVKRINQVLSL